MILRTARRRRGPLSFAAPPEPERCRGSCIRQIAEHVVSGRPRGSDVAHHIGEPRAATLHLGDALLEKPQSVAQHLREPLRRDGAIGIPQKQDFLDIPDGEAAMLELPHEPNTVERGGVIDAMSTLGASG
jgi:hypothetical protein